MERSLSHLSVPFLRFRSGGAVWSAAGALAASVTDHDLLVDVDNRCGSRTQGGVVGGCCRLDLEVVVVTVYGELGLCLGRTHRIEALRLDAFPRVFGRIVIGAAAKGIAGERV